MSIKLSSSNLELNLADLTFDELDGLGSLAREKIVFYLPLPSIGRTNMHVDICSDYIDACWAAEQLARHGENASSEELNHKYSNGVLVTLKNTRESLREAVSDCILVFQGCEDDAFQQRYQEIRDEIADLEENIDGFRTSFPDLIDSYYANLVNGAYHHYKSEAPEFYLEQISKHPEHQIGFHRSALSWAIGRDCYVSQDSWLAPSAVSLDDLFSLTKQRFRLAEFRKGDIFTIDGQSFVSADDQTTFFPMNQYFKSRVCASFDMARKEDEWPSDNFDWLNATFTHSPYMAELMAGGSAAFRAALPHREKCLVHQSGSLIVVDDGSYNHILYDTKPLNAVQVKKLHDDIAGLSLKLMESFGIGVSRKFDWQSLSDEQFERLCYDIIVAHPKFDADTVRKLGKSRSRDGGRDIEAREVTRSTMQRPKKWIFQCKLVTDGSSLSGRKVTDIGDMLEVHDAGGFGVMTNVPIDATLYDKCGAICQKRGIEELHFSVLEVERALARNRAIQFRYFPDLG